MVKIEIKCIYKLKDIVVKFKGKLLEDEELFEFIGYIFEGYVVDM